MAQYHESTPLKDRKSENIDVAHYLREIGPAVAAVTVGMIANFMQQKAAPKSVQARMLGAISVLSMAISPFLIWRKQEKENLGIHDLYDQYKEACSLRVNNDGILHDNKMLQKMVAYEERQQILPHVKDILAQGAKNSIQHSLQSNENADLSR